MTTIFKIHIDGKDSLVEEAALMLKEAGIEIKPTISTRGDPVSDILVAVGTSGVFVMLSQIICKFLERNKDCTVTIERKGAKVSVTGTLSEVKEMLEKFAPPELKSHKKTKHKPKHT